MTAQAFWLERLDGSRFNDWVFANIAPHLGRRVLEIGCGIGTYTQRIAGVADSVCAVEIDRGFADQARATLPAHVDVRCCDATTERWEGFDTAIALDVIEHLDDDVAMLRTLGSAARTVVVKVPAGEWLRGTLDDAVGHRRRYSTNSLTQAMTSAGLTDVRTWPFNVAAVPGWWLNGLLRRTTPPGEQVAAFDALVPLLRLIEDHIRVPFGLSLFGVGRSQAQ